MPLPMYTTAREMKKGQDIHDAPHPPLVSLGDWALLYCAKQNNVFVKLQLHLEAEKCTSSVYSGKVLRLGGYLGN